MEANQQATELLLSGISVDGLPDWDGGRGQTIHYIDWDHPENNRFTAINQYKVKCPPGHDSAKGHIIPDIVLLVNGIPLVVVECKSRTVPEGMERRGGPAAPLLQPAQGRLRGGGERGRPGPVPHQPVPRRHQLRRCPRRHHQRRLRALSQLEDCGAPHRGRGGA